MVEDTNQIRAGVHVVDTSDLATASAAGASRGVADSVPRETERIRTRCPSCGAQSLFIGSGGYLTCSVIGCREPGVDLAIATLRESMEHWHQIVREDMDALGARESGMVERIYQLRHAEIERDELRWRVRTLEAAIAKAETDRAR